MKKFFSILVAALLLIACTPQSEELGTPFKKGQEVTIAASVVNGQSNVQQLPGKQRVSGKDSETTIDLVWDEGDEILIKVGDATALFSLTSGAGTANATFSGTMPADGTQYSVIYPANYDESVLDTQNYVENGFGKGLMKMSTKSAGTLDGGFVLSADNALVAFNFTGEDALSKIVLTNPAASKSYTLACTGVTLNGVAKVFYFVVPAGTWSNGFVVEVYDAGGNVINSFTKEGSVDFSATSAVDMPEQEVEPVQITPGIGVFSVSADKQVTFSPGNLQYTHSTNTWSFASAQYECLGTKNVIDGWEEDDYDDEYGYSNSGTRLADKVDLFGWSTSTTNFGVSTSTSSSDYNGSFVDWGKNRIDKNAPNTWRTLTKDEWHYLLYNRTNADDLCGIASVEGVNGLIFLPDNWTCPAGVTFMPGFYGDAGAQHYYSYQYIPIDKWAKFEAAGAVFLPSAGYRNGTDVSEVRYGGIYWSSSEDSSVWARYVSFDSEHASMAASDRFYGRSVRLVKDIQGGSTPETPGNVENGHEYVDLGLSVKWATCYVGATTPEEYGDYFAWGEVKPKTEYNWSTYKWCNGSYDTQTKYCTDSYYGTVDNKTVLDKEDDAAAVNWGGAWRMPTKAEKDELIQQCTWTWTSKGSVNGFQVTGPNGNSIFLPAAGYRYGSRLTRVGISGYFWSSSLYTDSPSIAYYVYFDSSIVDRGYDNRDYGFSVRPVCQ